MATTAFKGSPVDTSGDLPAVGAAAPAFALTGGDLGAVSSEGLAGGRVVLNVLPVGRHPGVRPECAHVQRARRPA